MQIQSQIGIEAVKSFLSSALDAARLDRDGDGEISNSEWGQAVLSLLPQLLNARQLAAEVRDLTPEESFELLTFAKNNFPNYPGLNDRIEAVVKSSLNLLAVTGPAVQQLLLDIKALGEASKESKERQAVSQKARPGAETKAVKAPKSKK